TATALDGSPHADTGSDEVYISKSNPGTGSEDGKSIFAPVHIGPSDGKGGTGDRDNKNPDPQVYDDALLHFEHGISQAVNVDKLDVDNYYGIFAEYTAVYDVDPNLKLKTL